MAQTPHEWLLQADYDLETAECMLQAGRNIYAVFMVHLAVEKALKGVFHKKFGEMPPKTHNLIYLLQRIGEIPLESLGAFIVELDQASIATRYPEELASMATMYPVDRVLRIIAEGREVLLWVKKIF
ncbi:MAG: HEPN domain-containing protein [Candidatus Omnitrophica bacterium]|nr:HEPN domain-containing protein [Candidatus Omnitrophota bacterium]